MKITASLRPREAPPAGANSGQRIVEVAFERLSSGGFRTVDALLNPIRELEMSQPQETRFTDSGTSDSADIDDATLHSPTGVYQSSDRNVTAVKRDGATLLIQLLAGSSGELRPTS